MVQNGFRSVVRTMLASGLLFALSLPVGAEVSENAIGKLIDQGAYQEALLHIDQQMEEKGPETASLMLLKGAVLVRLGRLDEGMALFRSLAKKYPNDAAIHNNIGVIHAERGELELARQAFEQAVKISPDYQQAVRNLGDVYADLACHTYGQIKADSTIQIPSFCVAVEPVAVIRSEKTAEPDTGELSEAIKSELLEALDQWRSAWETQAIMQYLGFYSVKFSPDGMTLDQWRAKRERSIARPEWIKIRLENPELTLANARVSIRFRQDYRASNYRDVVNKELVFVREGAGWKIISERVL
ncbi:MAG: tetratricopeptide repeat protein [Sedimenticola sp.]|nr:tetratricopeptide repeat protein [Sedimenticola sp.]